MSTVDQTVRDAITAYPTLHTTRAEVLHFVLCVIGNGFQWRNGEPVEIDDPRHRSVPWTPEAHQARMLAQFAHLPDRARASLRETFEEERAECLAVLATVDQRVHDMTPLDHVYPQTEYALLMNVPDDVTADWAAACEQMRALVTEHGWVFPDPPSRA